jgi:hypothetical protein
MSKARRAYLLIHTPTHMARPVQMDFVWKDSRSDGLFAEYEKDVERNRQAGGGATYLSKRSIERWGSFPPVGARVQVLEVEFPRQEWFDAWAEAEAKRKPPVSSGDGSEGVTAEVLRAEKEMK